jgi:hypothetical protein
MNSQGKLKYISTEKRIYSIIKNRSKLNLLSTASDIIDILREDIFLSRYSVYFHLNKLNKKELIYFKIIPKKNACNKPTKYYFCKNKKNK